VAHQDDVEARKQAPLGEEVAGVEEALAALQLWEGAEAHTLAHLEEEVVGEALFLRQEAYMWVGQHHVAQSS
jgi:hypothetical protein